MSDIIIDKIRPEDIPAVMELHRELMSVTLSPEETIRRCRDLLQDSDRLFLVARADGEVAGTATVICCHGLTYEFLVIEDVVVRDDMQGCGIGRMLLEAADDFAREKGCLYSILVSSGHRTGAHRFYEKLGYTEDVRGFRKPYTNFAPHGSGH